MRVLILGGDGYLGWPTAMYLSRAGHDVAVVDNMVKRFWEAEVGAEPLIPIRTLQHRVRRWNETMNKNIQLHVGDIAHNHRFVYKVFDSFKPDAVIHYAEQPSAPFSMMDRDACYTTQHNNVLGNLNVMFAMQQSNPNIHMIKLGTMGAYGTPNIDIEEGWLELEHKGRKDKVLYPKKPGSFYHLSKVHDSANLEFACRIWGFKVTDLNQGVVYGTTTDETKIDKDFETSFHYDAIFGTVWNRFVTQAAAGVDLTVYGKGGQTRGYLNIRDTLKCVELALLNTPANGEYRVFNQFTEQFSVNELADKVLSVARAMGINISKSNLDNPRVELDNHYYNATHTALQGLGLKPVLLDEVVLSDMIKKAKEYSHRIDVQALLPLVRWNQR